VAWITRTDADGERVHSSEVVRHALPLLVLQSGLAYGVEPKIDAIMTRFVEAAGITEGMSPDAIVRATVAYYLRYPPDPRLMAELRECAESSLIAEIDAAAAKHTARPVMVPTSALAALAPRGRIERQRR